MSLSNTGWPAAVQQGFVERAIIETAQLWDMNPLRRPMMEEFLPPAPAPRNGAMAYEGQIMIDPQGFSPLSEPQADPTMVTDFYAKTHYNAYTVKKGFTYNSMDRVHGHQDLVANRSREMVEYNLRAIDIWTVRHILKDPIANAMFNPTGEYATYGLSINLTTPVDDSGSDLIGIIDDAMARAQYQGAPESVTPMWLVGPLGEIAMKSHPSLTKYAQYWDRDLFANPMGVIRMGVHGVRVRKVLGSYKIGPAGEPNIDQAAGTFQKSTLANKNRRFLMEDPADPTKECAILIWGGIGNIRFSRTDERNAAFGSGSGMVRGPVEDQLKGVWTTSIEHAFCPCIERPFNIVVIKNFCDSYQAMT